MGLGETFVSRGSRRLVAPEDAHLIWWRQTQSRASLRAILDLVPGRPSVQKPAGGPHGTDLKSMRFQSGRRVNNVRLGNWRRAGGL
jgi:hypothetical protein